MRRSRLADRHHHLRGWHAGGPSFDVQDRIARHTRACSYDRAGLGWSDPAPGRRSLVDATDDLEGVLAKGRVDGSVVLVPESFGGLIALSFLARAPSRVAGAVFVDASEPTLWFGRAERSVASWRLHNLWWGPAVDLGLVRALFPYLAPDWVRRLPEPRRDLFRAVYSRPTRGYGESANAVATAKGDQPVDLPGAMADRPLIVLEHGRPSAALPAMWESGWPAAQRRLAMLSTQGRLVVVADAGHAIAEEDPATVAAAVATVVDAARQRLRPPAP